MKLQARRSLVLTLLGVVSTLVGCVETGQDRALIPLALAGTSGSGAIEAAGEVSIALERADLAFGPLYLCAGTTAGDLCETARLEWLESAVINTLSDETVRVGELEGVTGSVRSWMYDLGLSSQLTRNEPFVLEAAETLGGTSFVLEGQATLNGRTLPLRAAIAAQQNVSTELGVPVVRKSNSERFSHDVIGNEAQLLLRFEIESSIRQLDLRSYFEEASCELGEPQSLCQANNALTCGEDGSEEARVDCAASDQVCIPGQGCADALVIEDGSEAHRTLRNALLTRARPEFTWSASADDEAL